MSQGKVTHDQYFEICSALKNKLPKKSEGAKFDYDQIRELIRTEVAEETMSRLSDYTLRQALVTLKRPDVLTSRTRQTAAKLVADQHQAQLTAMQERMDELERRISQLANFVQENLDPEDEHRLPVNWREKVLANGPKIMRKQK